MAKFEIIGDLQKVSHELVDYIANGFIIYEDDKIPCEVGFIRYGKAITAEYLFTDSGITEKGTAYYPQTISLDGSIIWEVAENEEQ